MKAETKAALRKRLDKVEAELRQRRHENLRTFDGLTTAYEKVKQALSFYASLPPDLLPDKLKRVAVDTLKEIEP